MQTVRIAIISDDHLARAGLAALLASQTAVTVIGQYAVDDFLTDWEDGETEPMDALIWDLGWEGQKSAFDLDLSPIPVIVLIPESGPEEPEWQPGWFGILSRQAPVAQIVAAVQAGLENLFTFDPTLLTFDTAVAAPSLNSAAPQILTPREQEVLTLLAEGLTNKAIGQRLEISNHTVKFHINAIMTKLDAQSRTDAVVRATRSGLLSL